MRRSLLEVGLNARDDMVHFEMIPCDNSGAETCINSMTVEQAIAHIATVKNLIRVIKDDANAKANAMALAYAKLED